MGHGSASLKVERNIGRRRVEDSNLEPSLTFSLWENGDPPHSATGPTLKRPGNPLAKAVLLASNGTCLRTPVFGSSKAPSLPGSFQVELQAEA